jgi:hypothetical protein
VRYLGAAVKRWETQVAGQFENRVLGQFESVATAPSFCSASELPSGTGVCLDGAPEAAPISSAKI